MHCQRRPRSYLPREPVGTSGTQEACEANAERVARFHGHLDKKWRRSDLSGVQSPVHNVMVGHEPWHSTRRKATVPGNPPTAPETTCYDPSRRWVSAGTRVSPRGLQRAFGSPTWQIRRIRRLHRISQLPLTSTKRVLNDMEPHNPFPRSLGTPTTRLGGKVFALALVFFQF